MDDVSKATQRAWGQALSADDANLARHIENCLKTRCNSAIGQCRSNKGPCANQEFRLAGRRACRPLKREIMEGERNACEKTVGRIMSLHERNKPSGDDSPGPSFSE